MRPRTVVSLLATGAVLTASAAFAAREPSADKASRGEPATTLPVATGHPKTALAPLVSPPGVERWKTALRASEGTPLSQLLAVRVLDDGSSLSVATGGEIVGFVHFDTSGQRLSSIAIREHGVTTSAAMVDAVGRVTLRRRSPLGLELEQYDGLDGSRLWHQWLASSSWDATCCAVPYLAVDSAGDIFVSNLETLGHWVVEKHDHATGVRLWGTSVDAAGTTPAMAVAAQGDLLVLYDLLDFSHPVLARYATGDGQRLWSVDLPPGLQTSLSIGAAGIAFAGVRPGSGPIGGSRVVALGTGGAVLWSRNVEQVPDRLAADGAGNVIVHYMSPGGSGGAALSKLSGTDGSPAWKPIQALDATAFGLDAGSTVYLTDGVDLAAYSSVNGAPLWNQPVSSGRFFNALLDVHAGRLALAGTASGLTHVQAVAAATGQVAFDQPLVTDPAVWPRTVSTDPQGNVLLVATTSHETELRTSVVKYDGRNGAPLWGPLERDVSETVLTTQQGDVLTCAHPVPVVPPSTSNATISKYSGQDGGLLWGPISISGSLDAVVEAPDHGVLILERERVGPNPGQALSKLDGGTGGVLWGPIPIDGSTMFTQLRFVPGGNIVLCQISWYGHSTLSQLDGATGVLSWRQPQTAMDQACEVDSSGNVYTLGHGLARDANHLGPLTVESYRGLDGQRLWRKPLPGADAGTNLLPDGEGGVLILRPYLPDVAVLRLGPDGRTLWGPRPMPGAVRAQGTWPNGDVLFTIAAAAPAGCVIEVARLSLQTGGLVWGPLPAGECGAADSALDARGNAAVSALRDGAWHVSLLQGDTGVALFDHALGSGEWPIDFGGLAFVGDDVVATGLHGFDGITARIGRRRRGLEPAEP